MRFAPTAFLALLVISLIIVSWRISSSVELQHDENQLEETLFGGEGVAERDEDVREQSEDLLLKAVERGGNIYCVDSSGKETAITSAGIDSQPSLSADQKLVTFVRENSKIMSENHFETLPATEIWKAPTDGSEVASMVVRHDHPLDEKGVIRNFSRPVFSNDNSKIYFLTTGWVTSRAIYSAKISDSSARFITGGNSLEIVRSGKWADNIITTKHKYFVGGGSYDWYWLICPEGKTIGPLGENTDYFRESWQ